MLDEDIVAVSPSSVYRVLKSNDMLAHKSNKKSLKGTGFTQPLKPHDHWHIDISYINLSGTFYYFCSVLDGCSRAILSWDLKPAMKEADVEIVIEKAKEAHPNEHPRIISDNGPQFIANDFKEFIRISEMTHVRTSPYYPQSNGKIERMHKTLKQTCIRPVNYENFNDIKRGINEFIQHYNDVRLHSAIGYITPTDKLAGNEDKIFKERLNKQKMAREERAEQLALAA